MMCLRILLIFSLTITFSDIVLAADYEHGHRALQIFDREGMGNAPTWVMIWIVFMMATFLSGLLFVWKQPIARWVVGGLFAGMAASAIATGVFGIPPLSGFIALMHLVFWSPGLYQLLTKRPFMKVTSAFSIWSAVMTFVILFSFIFDIRDTSLYLMHLRSS